MKYINSLRSGIQEVIEQHNAFLIGEDIQEPYGGAFKVTKGLSKKFPQNVIGTPMCEQAFMGMGVGMAVEGSYVIVESMFGDFITLMCDQMINHAAKFSQLYNEPLHLVLRCPSGGYRGYGATHSQSLEKMYLGIPGLQVIAASIANQPSELLKTALETGKPTLFVENKLDYTRDIVEADGLYWNNLNVSESLFPINRIRVKDETPDFTIVTYGGLISLALEVMEYFLYEEEINIDIIAVSDLNDVKNIYKHIDTQKILVLEEGVELHGWGAELAYLLARQGKLVQRCGAKYSYIPVAMSWEGYVLPSKKDIINIIRKEL